MKYIYIYGDDVEGGAVSDTSDDGPSCRRSSAQLLELLADPE